MKHATTIAVLVLSFIAAAARAQATTPADAARITVHVDRKAGTVNPLFFGVNTLFMYDDKAALADEAFAKTLRDAPVRLLRFPGGDVADNYLWDEHRLDDPHHWPKIDKPTSADTDAFMAFCRKVGAEPIFVVNLESGFVHNDMERAIRRAVDWVAYCNKTKGYNVRYWEIGNEQFWYNPGQHKRVRVTAAEYGAAFVRFAEAMKAVDPTIQVGAVGLVDPTRSANNTMPDGSQANPPEPPWWPTVMKAAAKHVDFASVHAYPGNEKQTYEVFIDKGVWGGETLPDLRKFLDESLGRRVPIALTEWNIAAKNPTRGMALAQAQANLLCRFLTAGVDMACLWPLRLPRGNARGLLDYESRTPQPMYHVFQMLSTSLPGSAIVEARADDPRLFHFATLGEDGKTVTLVLIHKSADDAPRRVTIDVPGFKAAEGSGETLVAPALDSTDVKRVPLTCERAGDAWSCELPPYSINLVKLTRQAREK